MAPRASTSAGGHGHKAFAASTSHTSGKSINSRLRDALSPSRSPSPPRHRSARSRSPRRRSRSPASPRPPPARRNSYSRRYEDDRHDRGRDSRNARRYEQSHVPDSERYHGRTLKRYDDLDDRGTRRDSHNRDYERPAKRRRSRSPYRRNDTSDDPARPSSSRGLNNFVRSADDLRNSETASSGHGRGSMNGHSKSQTTGKTGVNGSVATQPGVSSKTSDSNIRQDSVTSSSSQTDATEPEQPELPVQSESLSIEERRKRREEIRAKHRRGGSHLLAQALENSSAASSPRPDASPMTVSAATDPSIGSPESMSISSDVELANTGPDSRPSTAGSTPGGPSAADYDPLADMEEDRRRHMPHETEVSGVARDETGPDMQQDQVTIVSDRKDSQKSPDVKPTGTSGEAAEDSDSDIDMFAPPTEEIAKPIVAKPVAVKQARPMRKNMKDIWDDADGYYRVTNGELINDRYHVECALGRGMFSGVVRAQDKKEDKPVAIKIIRANEPMAKAAVKEMGIVKKLAEADPDDKKHIIRLSGSFHYKGHLCLVFENLNMNLREVLRKFGSDVGLNIKAVRSYAQQIFLGLGLLRKCNILHADLKPDNILVDDTTFRLKICDLGSAADIIERDIAPYLVSRFYRAPEIILGIKYDYAIDMWSIGCTLFEMFTGKILFAGRNNNGMLKSIQEIRGRIPVKMLKKGEISPQYFDEHGQYFRSVEPDKITGRDVVKMINFGKPTKDLRARVLAAAPKGASEHDMKELNLFADLLDRCLALNPERRITPVDALTHGFFKHDLPAAPAKKPAFRRF